MRVCRNMSPVAKEAFANSHRRFGRLRCNQVRCSLGEVLDLSGGGIRVRMRGAMGLKEGDTVGITVQAGASVGLPCRVVWMRKSAWRMYEAGLMFLDLTPAARGALNELARGITFQGELAPAFPGG